MQKNIDIVRYFKCKGCRKTWCNFCGNKRNMKCFVFDSKERCTNCFLYDEYRCTQCPQNDCGNRTCQLGWRDFRRQDGVTVRGYCCKAQGNTKKCLNCNRFEAMRISVVLLGIWRFRTNSVLAQLPRDVLRYTLLQQCVWNKVRCQKYEINSVVEHVPFGDIVKLTLH